jgi:hypothetical protein
MKPGERAHVRVTSRGMSRPLAPLHEELADDSAFYGEGEGEVRYRGYCLMSFPDSSNVRNEERECGIVLRRFARKPWRLGHS